MTLERRLMLDERGVGKLLEKLLGLAETASEVGSKSADTMIRTANISDSAKIRLVPHYQFEASERARGHARLGLQICSIIEHELADDSARRALERFRTEFQKIYDGISI